MHALVAFNLFIFFLFLVTESVFRTEMSFGRGWNSKLQKTTPT